MMPRVHRVRKPNGRVFKYHARSRAPLPNDVPEDHPRFIAAWTAAEAPDAPRKAIPGTVEGGCVAYLASASYRDLGDSYRPVIRRHVEAIRLQCARAPVPPMLAHMSAAAIRADLEPLKPAVAKARLQAWRKLAGFWFEREMTAADVSDGVRRKRLAKTAGFTAWTDADLAAFRDKWPVGTPQRLAMELLQWTGARMSDAVRLGHQHVARNGFLSFTQAKTGHRAEVPWHGPAHGLEAQRRDLMACLDGHDHLQFMVTAYGKPRSAKAASAWFSAAATDAGLSDLSAHGLRKYRMNQLAEAGVPLLGMQTWVGHETLEEVERYTRQAAGRNVFKITDKTNGGG